MRRSLAIALSAIAAGRLVSAQAPASPSFSTRVEAVRVDVLVTDNEQAVAALGPGDFEVLDNGVPQTVDLASDEEIPLNVVLALDLSASLDDSQLDQLTIAGKTLLDGLTPADQAALVTFSHVVSLGSPLTPDLARVRTALDAAVTSGQTSLVDATFMGIMTGESDVGRSLLLVFSDGVDTQSWLPASAVLDTAKRSDVVIYGVETGRARVSFPRELSAATGGRLIQVESTRDLSATFRAVLDEFRKRYLLSYSPRGVAPGGWHRLEVRVKGRRATVRARPGYLSGN